jgi:hypothetical protein
VNIVRSVVFRRTYAARLFSLPIVTLPDIGERTEAVEFCEVEKALYAMIISQFKEHIQAEFGRSLIAMKATANMYQQP